MFQCKHEWKEKLHTGIIKDVVNCFNPNDGQPMTYLCNAFEIYLCHDCKCVVWEKAKEK